MHLYAENNKDYLSPVKTNLNLFSMQDKREIYGYALFIVERGEK